MHFNMPLPCTSPVITHFFGLRRLFWWKQKIPIPSLWNPCGIGIFFFNHWSEIDTRFHRDWSFYYTICSSTDTLEHQILKIRLFINWLLGSFHDTSSTTPYTELFCITKTRCQEPYDSCYLQGIRTVLGIVLFCKTLSQRRATQCHIYRYNVCLWGSNPDNPPRRHRWCWETPVEKRLQFICIRLKKDENRGEKMS